MTASHGDALLRDAIQRNDQTGIADALARGADPNMQIDGAPLLTIAAVGGQDALVEALLKAEADPNATDQDGRTALMYIAWLGFTESHRRIFDSLIDAGADVNAQDNHQATAIDMAARFLNIGMVRLLQGLGAKCRASTSVIVQSMLKDDPSRLRQ